MSTGLAVMRTTSVQGPAVTPGRQAFVSLESWLGSATSQQMGLCGIEREIERRGREIDRHLLQEHIDKRGPGDVGGALWVSAGDGVPVLYSHKRLHTRQVVTLFGTVSVTRMGYSMPGRPSVHPLDAALQLPARSFSYEIQRRLVKGAVLGPFDEALDVLADTTGSWWRSSVRSKSCWRRAWTSRASTPSARHQGRQQRVLLSWPPSTAKASRW